MFASLHIALESASVILRYLDLPLALCVCCVGMFKGDSQVDDIVVKFLLHPELFHL